MGAVEIALIGFIALMGLVGGSGVFILRGRALRRREKPSPQR